MRFAPGSMDHFLGVSDCPAGTGTSASSQLFRHQKELVPGTLDIQSENSAGKESVATCLYASAFNSEVSTELRRRIEAQSTYLETILLTQRQQQRSDPVALSAGPAQRHTHTEGSEYSANCLYNLGDWLRSLLFACFRVPQVLQPRPRPALSSSNQANRVSDENHESSRHVVTMFHML